MNHRTAGYGAAIAALAALAVSSCATLFFLRNTELYPADFGNPEYLALVMWSVLTAVSVICAAAVLHTVFKTTHAIYKHYALDCYRLVSPGTGKTKYFKGKEPKK